VIDQEVQIMFIFKQISIGGKPVSIQMAGGQKIAFLTNTGGKVSEKRVDYNFLNFFVGAGLIMRIK
jgi:hypothetical protein